MTEADLDLLFLGIFTINKGFGLGTAMNVDNNFMAAWMTKYLEEIHPGYKLKLKIFLSPKTADIRSETSSITPINNLINQ